MSDFSATFDRSGGGTDRTDRRPLATLNRGMELWDWRRRVSDLYAQIRTMQPSEGWRHWRAVRDDLFRHHPQSPLSPPARGRFDGINCYDYDPSYRFVVECMPLTSLATLRTAAGDDGDVVLRPFGQTRGLAPRLGGELTLYWIEGYGGGVFLPFKDETNGTATFSGGRYLLDTIKGADLGWDAGGHFILDFNFAYNPSCAYSDQWACPLAPSENTIRSPVSAGERTGSRGI